MATKHGEEAIKAWAAKQAAFKAKRNIVFAIVAIVVVVLVLNAYVF